MTFKRPPSTEPNARVVPPPTQMPPSRQREVPALPYRKSPHPAPLTGAMTTTVVPGPVTSPAPVTSGQILSAVLDESQSVEKVAANQPDPAVVDE